MLDYYLRNKSNDTDLVSPLSLACDDPIKQADFDRICGIYPVRLVEIRHGSDSNVGRTARKRQESVHPKLRGRYNLIHRMKEKQ